MQLSMLGMIDVGVRNVLKIAMVEVERMAG